MHYQRIENALKTLTMLFSLSPVFPDKVTSFLFFHSSCEASKIGTGLLRWLGAKPQGFFM